MSDPIVITRELVKRGWSDFEPKLITGLLTGAVASFIVSILATYGVTLSSLQQNFVAVACFFIGGYLTPSTGTAVTKRIDSGLLEVEQHSANTVTTVTGPVPIVKVPHMPNTVKVPNTDTGTVMIGTPAPAEDVNATKVIPTAYSRGANFLDQLPSSTTGTP